LSKKVVTLYLSTGPYEELKRVCSLLGISVSSKIDEWIREGLQELTGKEYSVEEASYEELKRAHQRLIRETKRLESRLKKRGVYQELIALAENVGFRRDRMDEADSGDPEEVERQKGRCAHIRNFAGGNEKQD